MRWSALKSVLSAASVCLLPAVVFAQQHKSLPQRTAPSDAFSNLAGCGCCGTFIAIPIALVVLNIAQLVWVARDAKARGMDSSVLWMLLVFFTSFLGLVIYKFSRPQGNLVPCANCGNKKLQATVKCPHCGFGA
jgi:small-conductance mechanosensitive channel